MEENMRTTHLSLRVLPRRSLVVAVVLTLVFVGLLTQPAIPLSAQTDATPDTYDGIALWVNATQGSSGLVWPGSSSSAEGLVHSNRDLTINGSNNSLLGGTEYVRRLRVNGRNNLIDPPATKVTSAEFPITFDIADYRSGGVVALAAGSQYYDGTAECELDGTWERHVSGTEIITGLYYVPCDVIISAADITGLFTIVAEGSIQVTAARMTFGPAFTDDLLLFSNSETNNAILIAGDDSSFDGFVYAPLGSVMLTGANHYLRCGILADEIAINGSGHRFAGDPTCGNRSPMAVEDTYTTGEDLTLVVAVPGVLGNDSDTDGDLLTASMVADVSNGTLTLNPDGSFTYLPTPDFYGEDSFTYKACDTGTPALCDSALVTITVNAVNDAPLADPNGSYSGSVGSAVSFDGSDSSDVDGTIVSYDWQFGDGTTSSGANPSHTYAEAGLYTVSLTVTDDGGLTDTASTTADITEAPNLPPVAAEDAYATDEDVTLVVAAPGVLGNDSDADGDPLTASLVAGVSNGTLILNPDGSFSCVPNPNFSGDDSFTYRANDGAADSNVVTVVITVNEVNDPPVADPNGPYSGSVGSVVSFDGSGSSDVDGTIVSYDWQFGDGTTGSGATPSYTYEAAGLYKVSLTVTDNGGLTNKASTTTDIAEAPNTPPVAADDAYETDEDTLLSVAAQGVLSNDSDADGDPLAASLVADVSNGTLALQADGAFSYVPNPNFSGDDSFTYRANDGAADSNVATVTITVYAVNDSPVAAEDAYTIDEDVVLSVNAPGVLGNDSDDDGDPLIASLVADVSDGLLTLQADGSFSYIPRLNFNGTDSFTYEACDTEIPPLCDSVSVAITVNAVNDAPLSEDDAYATTEDVLVSVAAPGVLGNDSDADGDPLTVSMVADVSNGTLTLNPDGSFTYLPNPDFYGEDSFTYEACDTGTPPLCDSALVTITVNAVNDVPVAEPNGPYSGSVGSAVSFDGSGSSDVDGTIVSYDWDFGDGTTGSGATPSHTYAETGLYTVSLTVTDNGGLTDTTSTTVDIAGIPNTAPVAVSDVYATDEDVIVSVAAPGVLGNDSDVDGDPLTAVLVADVSHGTLTLDPDGSFSYLPDLDFNGVDSFTYVANDGMVDSNIATVTITVNPVNDPPVADAGPDQTVTVGDLVTLDGSGSSDLVEGDLLTYLWVFLVRPDGSTATLTGATSVASIFIPDLPGDYVVELTVDDGNGGTATDTRTVSADPIGMTISLVDTLIGVGRTTDGTITLDHPAPPGGITVTISLDTAIATVDPTAVPIAGGATESTFVLTGVAVGATTITGSSPATEMATADVQVTDSLISIDDIPVLAPEESADLPVSITKPAPGGGLTIMLESLDPTIASTDPTVFIPEGLYVPTSNPQITGVAFGTTQIKATALAFGPDMRDVTVALQVTLSPAELDLPELWTLYVTAHLSAPAPLGGVTLDLWLDVPLATVPANVFIPAGQTLSGPIGITGGTTPGTTTLHAGGAGLLEGTTVVNVIGTPDVYLRERWGGNIYYREPFVVGVDLQIITYVQFEVALPGPVDVIVSAPPGSGVLFSLSPTEVGSESLVVATGFTSNSSSPYTSNFYVQGTIQGDDVGDNVPVTIDVFETGTTDPAGYEQADMPSEVDVGPSGFLFLNSNDLDAPTFPNTDVEVQSWVLYDGESGTLHNRLRYQQTRGGHTITVELTNSNPLAGTVVAPAVFTGGDYRGYAEFDGLTAGTTSLGIIQPAGHTEPANGYVTRTVNVTAPDVYLRERWGGNIYYREPFVVGVDLQIITYVQFEVALPGPVDVIVSAPPGSGVLFSLSPTEVGSESLVVATGFTSNSSSPYTSNFYVQGTIQGDDVGDNVPVTIDVFETGTTDPAGYEQADMPSEVDVGPSGFLFLNSNDLDAPTFPNTDVEVQSWVLYDGESGTLHNRLRYQQTRGGHTITVELTNSNPLAGTVVAPAVFTGGLQLAYAEFDPLTSGSTTLGIIQTAGHTEPANGYLTRTVNVDAPNLYLQRYVSGWQPSPDENIGRDLQVERRIGLEVAPPAPGVDVTIEVADPSVALISTDPTTIGSASITFPLVTGTFSPLIYVQGLTLGQGTDLRITAPGYDQWITTIQIVEAGFYIYTPGSDFSTTVDAGNRTVQVRPASLDTLQRVDEAQQVRGGLSFSVDVVSYDLSVGVITISPLVFTGIDDYLNTAFDPIAVGATTISITQPAGFTPPAGKTSVMATVNPE
jgi:VCBS repeat-containing protein